MTRCAATCRGARECFMVFADEFFRVTPRRVSDPIGQRVALSSRAEGLQRAGEDCGYEAEEVR